jgi:hypothetical protein
MTPRTKLTKGKATPPLPAPRARSLMLDPSSTPILTEERAKTAQPLVAARLSAPDSPSAKVRSKRTASRAKEVVNPKDSVPGSKVSPQGDGDGQILIDTYGRVAVAKSSDANPTPGAKGVVSTKNPMPPTTSSASNGREPGLRSRDARVRIAGLESSPDLGEGGGYCSGDAHRLYASPQNFPGDGDGSGQYGGDTQESLAASDILAGQNDSETQHRGAGQDQGYGKRDTHVRNALIQNIKARYRLRIFYRDTAGAVERRLFSYCYALCSASMDKAAAKTEAGKMSKAALKGDAPIELVAMRCDLLIDHHKAMKAQQAEQEKALDKLAKQLPAWSWVDAFKGLGPGGFAEIVAHCGDLGQYDNPAKVWKRMGLAVFDGKAQGKRKDAAEAAIHGFSPRRRAVMHCLGESILRARRLNPEYGEIYDARKALEAAKPECQTKMHAHKRAMRYIEKRLLKHLWQAWRAECGQDRAEAQSPSAHSPAEIQEAA